MPRGFWHWLILSPIILIAFMVAMARAEWKPEYALQPPEVREWYRSQKVNPEAREKLHIPFESCCDHADVVKTQFRVNRIHGGDEWFYEDAPGHFKRIPPEVIHWGETAPGGQPTLFVYSGKETCFFPGDSGI